MSRSQLPLNALRAFEAAARHASFTHAAEELHVTQAAVSHQVKALEERLGVALFVRRPRGLEITGEGAALLPDLRDAFDRMTNALERVGRKANSGTLNVSLVTTFALGWLAPRLHRFQAKHPEIEVRMTTTIGAGLGGRENGTPPPNVPLDDVDLGKRRFWSRDDDLRDAPFSQRRSLLEEALADAHAPIHLTRISADVDEGRRWFQQFEGATRYTDWRFTWEPAPAQAVRPPNR